jgi:hypothetical protein
MTPYSKTSSVTFATRQCCLWLCVCDTFALITLGTKFLEYECCVKAAACVCAAIEYFGHVHGLDVDVIELQLGDFLDRCVGRDIMYIIQHYDVWFSSITL